MEILIILNFNQAEATSIIDVYYLLSITYPKYIFVHFHIYFYFRNAKTVFHASSRYNTY